MQHFSACHFFGASLCSKRTLFLALTVRLSNAHSKRKIKMYDTEKIKRLVNKAVEPRFKASIDKIKELKQRVKNIIESQNFTVISMTS